MARTTWDVWVVLANDVNQTVAYVPRWKSIQFSDQLNDVGSATLEHDFSDPFFAFFQDERGDSLLEGPYALQIRRDGTPVFTFFIEDVQVDRAGVSQALTIGGRGIASSLEWGIVLPEDFSNQARATAGTTQRPKFFDRLFPGYAYNVRVATTATLPATYANGPQLDVPGAGARLTATANGSINNAGIDGVTDLVVGDTVLVKNQTDPAHNGVYWIVTVGSASAPYVIQRTARADGSPIDDLAVNNAAFINEGTVNGYSSWAISSNGSLSSSTQVGTNAIVWTQVSLGSFTGISAFYILFREADTGYEYSTNKATFGNIKTLNGRGGIGYAVDWPLSLDSVLNSAMGKTDSKSHVVQDGGNFNIAVGRTLLDVLNEVSSNTGVDWHVSPEGIISIAIRPFVSDTVVYSTPFGNDLTTGSAALLFSLPMLETVETRTSVSELRTVVFGSDGFNLDRQISDRTGTYGFRELFIENTSDDAPAVANITASAVRQVRDGKLQITTSFAEREGMTAWQDFGIGDKVLVEIDTGTFSERIISAIGASVDENGNETVEVTFGDVFQDIASNLKYAANYGRLGAAEIPTYTLRGTSSRPSRPTGTSVGAEVQGLSNRVVASWEPPDNTSAAQYEAVVYREEQNTSGVAVIKTISNIYRSGNIAYVTTSSAHGYSVGDLINVYDTTDQYWDKDFIFITSVSSSATFSYDNVGPDISSGVYTSGSVVRIVERHSTIVPSGQNSAAFENLAAPGREYQFTVVPYTVNGQAGLPSEPFPFTASASAQILLNGAIRSNNYVEDVSGWTIEASGDAELNSVTVRNGTWVQGTLTAPTIQTATVNPRIIVNSSGLYAYDSGGTVVTSISSSTGAFFSSSASVSGNITANSLTANATITSPIITGGTIDIGGADTTSFHVDASGNMWAGSATLAGAPFQVSSAGALTATSAAITGGTIDVGENDATSFHVDSSGNMWLGAATFASAPFRVTSAGALTATSATISGNITSTSGNVAGWTLNNNSFSSSYVTISNSGYPFIRFNTQSLPNGGLFDISVQPGTNIPIVELSRGAFYTFIAPGYVQAQDFVGNLSGTASNADALAGYSASFSESANTVPLRQSDQSIRAGYFVFTGDVGIGATAGNDIRRRDDGYILIVGSKRELKHDIEDVVSGNAISVINSLSPVSFRWNEEQYTNSMVAEKTRDYKEYGFVVEDVAAVAPELVSYGPNSENTDIEPSMWSTHGVVSLLTAATKGLISEIETLKSRLAALESQP